MTDVIKNNRSALVLAVFAIILALGAISIGSYLFYEDFKFRNTINKQIKTIEFNVTNHDINSENAFSELKDNYETVESQVRQLTTHSINFSLFQVNQLITMATQSLLVYNDIKTTVKLLNYAKDILDNQSDVAYTKLKYALNNDLLMMSHVQDIDSISIASKINVVMVELGQMPLLPHLPQQNLAQVTPQKSSFVLKIWQNIKHSLATLVTISKVKQDESIILLPNQEIIVRQNMQLDMLAARMALQKRDQPSWQYNLTMFKQDLNKYFAVNSLTNTINANIDDLLNLNIAAKAVNMDATLKALTELNSNIK